MSLVSRWWGYALMRSGTSPRGEEPDLPSRVGHAVYLYGDEQELLDRLEAFVTDGWADGQTTVLFAEHERIKALRLRLAAWDLQHAIEPHDATWALEQFVRDGVPDPGLFARLLDHTLATREPGSVRLYGEMVSALWRRGEASGALQLEAMWNEYLDKHPAPLLCAYPRESVEQHHEHAAVCSAHDHVFPSAAVH